ncbi:hypothetical protein [Mesorhizobium atlanticum]|uniref:Uncharacterized protein n=1 Tax=Mesorhizobium atlanticum TaxID=2233532 RepID=A0A330GSN9_9HYPH|nr:hypothetical protein [Mesorhizobium atlanticum]RAZ77012.1 hypothetical protein DPM35_10865 [Mesorhizobium atlanticum]
MAEKYRWTDPAMTTVTRAPDDPNNQVSIDAAGNKPPKDILKLANMKQPKLPGGDNSPEWILFGDKTGDE